MISWHKPGQKVVCIRESNLIFLDGYSDLHSAPPAVGEVYTIAEVVPLEIPSNGLLIGFSLAERPDDEWFSATLFSPVYPQIIDQLRNLVALSPESERVKEDAYV